MSEYVRHDPFLTDLEVMFTGQEECRPGHAWGPAVRGHWKIHWITAGSGRFLAEGRQWRLGPGQGFLIAPDQVVQYQTDLDDPWHYAWIGFRGLGAQAWLSRAGVTRVHPMLSCALDGEFAKTMKALSQSRLPEDRDPLTLVGLLYQGLAALTLENTAALPQHDPRQPSRIYVEAVLEYVEAHLGQPTTVTEIANHVGLHRSYLGTVFRSVTGRSVQEHLIASRMRRACSLLESDHLGVKEIASSVGYDDALLFSKMFRRTVGLSPTQFRKALSADDSRNTRQVVPEANVGQPGALKGTR